MCGSDPKIDTGEYAKDMMNAFVQNYPKISEEISASMPLLAEGQLKAAQATYPQQQALGVNTDLSLLKGAGGQLANEAVNLDRQTNPEFYKMREGASNSLGDLFKSIDLSGNLSGGERAEIERSVNRSNINSGINSPTPTSTIADAMTFGNASTQRKLQQQGVLTGALGATAGLLPASRSGVDTFKVATGRDSTAATANSGASQIASGLLGNFSDLAGGAMGGNASRRSAFEKVMGSMPDYS